jgi:nitrate/nitrite transporter NarK
MSLYVTGFGASIAVAGTVVGALSIASMCVRPFSGLLSDRFSRKHLLTFSLLGVSLAMAMEHAILAVMHHVLELQRVRFHFL